jgi:hypothetical protein
MLKRLLFFLLLPPLSIPAQIFTGTYQDHQCYAHDYCIKINADSSLVFTESFRRIIQPKKSTINCWKEKEVLSYAYGRIIHEHDSTYRLAVYGDDHFNFELTDGPHDLVFRSFGKDTLVISFDSIKPGRILMKSLYSFKLRYENGIDTVCHYSDLKLPSIERIEGNEYYYQDTDAYSRFCRSYPFRFNPNYFKPGQKIYIDLGLKDRLTGKNYEFAIPFGQYPLFSWNTRFDCWGYNDGIYLKNNILRLCPDVILKKRE